MHDPNIPVLGDCDQVISCGTDLKRSGRKGSIDQADIRKDIVYTMERR